MIEVGAPDARARLPELLRRVEAAETVTITRRGRVVGQLVPDEAARGVRIRQAIENIRAVRPTMSKVRVEEMLETRDEGRRF